jgi:anti-anti-sigma regulatory factor
MVAGNDITIRHESEEFSYQDACCLAVQALRSPVERVIIDLRRTSRTSTAALARLVLLRRHLLQRGGDLHILGLCQTAKAIYEFNRMSRLLPTQN